MSANQLRSDFLADNRNFFLGLNIRSLRCHLDELQIEIKKFRQPPKVIGLTETWLTKNDSEKTTKRRKKQLRKSLDLENYHPIASKLRRSNKARGGVAFYVEEPLKYFPGHFETEIECTILKIGFAEKILRTFCVVYRPQLHKMKGFLHNFEDLIHFLRTFKRNTILFGDFNIDTIKESKDKSDYENLITAYCFKRQNSEPTRVTPTSPTGLDHLLTRCPVKNETIKTTFSGHYTIIGEIHIETKSFQENRQQFFKTRNRRNSKGDKAVNFLFPLDQKLMNLVEEKLTTDIISRIILDYVDQFCL